MKRKQLFVLFHGAALLMLFALIRCANPVMPLGGEKDITPPRVVQSVPENYAVNFDKKIITISFDEFIKLDKISQQALISPPLKENPEYRLRGKSLQIIFSEDLHENTTYNLYFGNAIVDLNENNPLESFNFVFSTGPVLDSMSLAGTLNFAFDNSPAEAVIMLYRDEHDSIPGDSLPYLVKPYYVTRANKEGKFQFRNLRNEAYRIFALEDKNSNFLYDKGGEAIGFVDSLVYPQYISSYPAEEEEVDSTAIQSADRVKIQLATDSLQTEEMEQAVSNKISDSLFFQKHILHNLRLFYEVDSTQRLLRTELLREGLLRFAFRYKANHVQIETLDSLPDAFQIIKQYSKESDTIWWHYPPDILDSLHLRVSLDTIIDDTLNLALKPRLTPAQQRAQKDDAPKYLNFITNFQNQSFEIGQDFLLIFQEPVVHYAMRDTNILIVGPDSLLNAVSFKKHDSIGLRYALDYKALEPEMIYGISVPDSVFFGLSGATNDTITTGFKVPALSDFGNLIMDIELPPGEAVILQLLNAKKDLVKEAYLTESGKQTWELLKPGVYSIKAIHDSNRNKVWDTGILNKWKQPEKVSVFEKEIEIRANWDLEEKWDLSH